MPVHPFLFYTHAYNIVFASCWCIYFGSMRKRERFVVGGSKERCKLHGISFSFNPLYLVLTPVVRGRRPETKETVCERQTLGGGPQWNGFGGLGDEVWWTVERGHWFHLCSSLALRGLEAVGTAGDDTMTLERSWEAGKAFSSAEWFCCSRHGDNRNQSRRGGTSQRLVGTEANRWAFGQEWGTTFVGASEMTMETD